MKNFSVSLSTTRSKSKDLLISIKETYETTCTSKFCEILTNTLDKIDQRLFPYFYVFQVSINDEIIAERNTEDDYVIGSHSMLIDIIEKYGSLV